jgi:esterase/lipase
MNRARKFGIPVAVAGLLVAGLLLLTPKPVGWPFDNRVQIGINFDDGGPDDWVAFKNKIAESAFGLVAGTEARIVWREQGVRTEYAVVYLHGFSASRQEIAPVPEQVAEQLGANLYEARLNGHGHKTSPMYKVSAEGWIVEGTEALHIGAALGDKVILISTSTGGALSFALLGYPIMENVQTLAMISPNVEVADPSAKWLTRPAGPLIANIVTSGTRSWAARNELQERYWTTSYPTDAVVEVMRLVDYANTQVPAPITQNLLMFISPNDQVISPLAAKAAFDAIQAPAKRLIEIDEAGDASNHVLAGDIMSPENTASVVAEIVRFVRSPGREDL